MGLLLVHASPHMCFLNGIRAVVFHKKAAHVL